MIRTTFFRLLAAASLAMAAPASAQITQIDPNDAGEYEPAANAAVAADAQYGAEPQAGPEAEYQDIDAGVQAQAVAPVQAAPTVPPAAATTASAGDTVPREDIFSAAEGVFGKGAADLAGMLERILKDQGQPSAYIAGQEAGGAFIVGVRYGSGTMHHQVEGQRAVHWTGPSIGFDAGADANKVFVLVYNLNDSQDLFKAYPSAEGRAYAVGGFTASYLRRGNVVLIPVRLGVGLRLGVNAGYMRFSEKNRWLPF